MVLANGPRPTVNNQRPTPVFFQFFTCCIQGHGIKVVGNLAATCSKQFWSKNGLPQAVLGQKLQKYGQKFQRQGKKGLGKLPAACSSLF
jgi:hypothetical protein